MKQCFYSIDKISAFTVTKNRKNFVLRFWVLGCARDQVIVIVRRNLIAVVIIRGSCDMKGSCDTLSFSSVLCTSFVSG